MTTCARQRCKTRTWNGYDLCKTHLTQLADKNFAAHVKRDGKCELAQFRPSLRCDGPLECCHIVTRSRHVTRWSPANALPGCSAHHLYFTHRRDEWRTAINDWQPGLYDHLLLISERGTKAEAQGLMGVWL